MKTISFVIKYKEIIFSIIIISFFVFDYDNESKKNIDLVARYSIFLLLIIGGLLAEIIYKKKNKKIENNKFIQELNKDIHSNRQRGIVIFRSSNMPGLMSGRLSEVIHEKDWWDWTYVDNSAVCHNVCNDLSKEVNDVYLDMDIFEKIKTSAIYYVNDTLLDGMNYIFLCDIILPGGITGSDKFPKNLWEAEGARGFHVEFSKLYSVESVWSASKGSCAAKDITVEREHSKIKMAFDEIHEKMRLALGDSYGHGLVWKEKAPSLEERDAFLANLNSVDNVDCPKNIFVIHSRSGKLREVFNRTVGDDTPILRKIVAGLMVVIGWLLSPLTFYNDLIVNIPLAVVMGSLLSIFFGSENYSYIVAACYLGSNVLGILMVWGGLRLGGFLLVWKLEKDKIILGVILFGIISFMLVEIYSFKFDEFILVITENYRRIK